MGQFLQDQNYMDMMWLFNISFQKTLALNCLQSSTQMLESVCDEVWLTAGVSGHPEGVGNRDQDFVQAGRALSN